MHKQQMVIFTIMQYHILFINYIDQVYLTNMKIIMKLVQSAPCTYEQK